VRKKLFLHIGCGKTGSSALQLWLAENRRYLSKYNIEYPLFSKEKYDEYEITSGNGVPLFQEIKKRQEYGLLEKILKQSKKNILFSSETFQGFVLKELHTIHLLAEKYHYDVHIIVYVRDVYDIMYSSYLQFVKRHLYTDTFFDMIKNLKAIQQFDVVRTYEKVFQHIHMVHYDSAKKEGIDKAFYSILGLADDQIPPMKAKKVNRSLTVFETELMRKANALYKTYYRKQEDMFSFKISNALIYASPEKKTEIYFNQKIVKILEEKFQQDIERINERYFKQSRLKVFDPVNKYLVETLPEIPEEYYLMLSSVLMYTSGKKVLQPLQKTETKDERNSELVSLLVKEAAKKEKQNPESALTLLKAAKVIRPRGPHIKKKIAQCKDRLTQGKNTANVLREKDKQ